MLPAVVNDEQLGTDSCGGACSLNHILLIDIQSKAAPGVREHRELLVRNAGRQKRIILPAVEDAAHFAEPARSETGGKIRSIERFARHQSEAGIEIVDAAGNIVALVAVALKNDFPVARPEDRSEKDMSGKLVRRTIVHSKKRNVVRSGDTGAAFDRKLAGCELFVTGHRLFAPVSGKMSDAPVGHVARKMPGCGSEVFHADSRIAFIDERTGTDEHLFIKFVAELQHQRMHCIAEGENERVIPLLESGETEIGRADPVGKGEFKRGFVKEFSAENGKFTVKRRHIRHASVTVNLALFRSRHVIRAEERSAPVKVDGKPGLHQSEAVAHHIVCEEEAGIVLINLDVHDYFPSRHHSTISSTFPVARLIVVSAPP